jgi:RNA polymerase sigma-70 factor, ECF subfamily
VQEAQPGDAKDAAIVRAVAGGDQLAVADLYERHAGSVYGMAVSILRDSNLAQDVTQEVFVRLWTRARTFDSRRGTVLAWLVSVARNLAIDELRRQRRRTEGADRLARDAELSEQEDPEVLLEWRWDSGRVREAVAELSAVQRQTVQLVYVQGFTLAEAAARLGVPAGTVKSRLHSALLSLRASLGEETRAGRVRS